MNGIVKTIDKILIKYSYKLVFEPYHTDQTIRKYKHLKDRVNTKKYFSIRDRNNYLICRLKDVDTSNADQMNYEHINDIISAFKMFEIKNNGKIVDEINKIKLHY